MSTASQVISVDLGDLRLSVAVHGSGPAVLLVQGGAAAGDGYFPGAELVAALSPTHSVIVVDRVGTGTSAQRAAGPDHLAQQAADLKQVIHDAGRGPALVVAHSLGGPVSLQLALDHPEVVSGLILLDPTPITDIRNFGRGLIVLRVMARLTQIPALGRMLQSFLVRQLDKDLLDIVRTPALDAASQRTLEPQALWRSLPLLTHFADDSAQLCAGFEKAPTKRAGVLVTAERKPKHAAHVAHVEMARLAGLELQEWSGTTHVIHLQRPQQIIELVEKISKTT